MQRERVAGWLITVAGLAAALVIQRASPMPQPPLYDGVVVVDPYLWLDPPPGHPGGATASSGEIAVHGERNDLFAGATEESPPQAQVFGVAGSLVLAAHATSISMMIEPVPSPAVPSRGYIDGNVYRFEFKDQLGRTVAARADALVTIILRPADPGVRDATVVRFNGGEWQTEPTSDSGQAGYEAVVTDFGDFAILGQGISPYPTQGAVPTTAEASSSIPGASAIAVPSFAPQPGAGSPENSSVLLILAAAGVTIAVVAFIARRRRYSGPPGWGPR